MGKLRKPQFVFVPKGRTSTASSIPASALDSSLIAGKMAEVNSNRTSSAQSSSKSSPPSSTSKCLKHDPPSPDKASSTISMELLLQEIRALRPFVEETNKMQFLEEKWSTMETRVSLMEQQLLVVQDDSQRLFFGKGGSQFETTY